MDEQGSIHNLGKKQKMEPVPVWQDYVWPQPDGTVRLLYAPNQRTEFAVPERGPMDTPSSFQSSSSSSSEQGIDFTLKGNPFANETTSDAQDAILKLDREFQEEIRNWHMLNHAIMRKMEAELSYEDLILILWDGWQFNPQRLLSLKDHYQTREDILRGFVLDDRGREHYDLTSATLADFQKWQKGSLVQLRWLITEVNHHVNVVNAKWYRPRGLKEEHLRGLGMYFEDGNIDAETYTKEYHEKRLRELRESASFEKVSLNLATRIRDYESEKAKLILIEDKWKIAKQGEPTVNEAGTNWTEVNASRDLLEDLQTQWSLVYDELKAQEQAIAGLMYWLGRQYPNQLKPELFDYVRYGTNLGEDMPPWREQELRDSLDDLVGSYQNALKSVQFARDQLARKPDLHELRLRYTTLGGSSPFGKPKLRSNAAEKSLRQAHQDEWEAHLKRSLESEKSYEKLMNEWQQKLDDFLERKAQLEGTRQPKKPKQIVIDLLSDE